MKTYLMLIIVLIFSTTTYAQENKHSHDEHLSFLVTSYLEMKDALAADDFEKAKSALQTFSEEVKMNKEMMHHPEHSEMLAEHHNTMISAVESASASTNIDEFRQSFDEISDELAKAVKNQNYDKTLHIQFCPMADNGNGAKWLSKQKEIKNPYFGEMMQSCGSTMETIN